MWDAFDRLADLLDALLLTPHGDVGLGGLRPAGDRRGLLTPHGDVGPFSDKQIWYDLRLIRCVKLDFLPKNTYAPPPVFCTNENGRTHITCEFIL